MIIRVSPLTAHASFHAERGGSASASPVTLAQVSASCGHLASTAFAAASPATSGLSYFTTEPLQLVWLRCGL